MRVVADHAVDGDVLALELLLVLLVVLDEAILRVHALHRVAAMALTACAAIGVDLHPHAARIRNVLAARAVTRLALDARFSPGANDAGELILLALRCVSGGVARAAVVRELFDARIVGRPACLLADGRVGEIELVQVFRVADGLGCGHPVGDDIPVLVHEAGFPVVAADDVGDVFPLIAGWRSRDLGERVLWRLAIHYLVELPGMPRLHESVVEFGMACLALGRADVCRAGDCAHSGRAGRSWRSGGSGITLWPDLTGIAFWPTGTCIALRPDRASLPRRTRIALRSLSPDRARATRRTLGASRTRLALQAGGACWTSGACIALRPYRALDARQAGRACGTLRACRTLWASRADRAGTSGAGGQGNRQDGKDRAQERSAGHRRLLPGEWSMRVAVGWGAARIWFPEPRSYSTGILGETRDAVKQCIHFGAVGV